MGDSIRMIYVEVDPDANMDKIIPQIELLLVKRHDVTLDTADFTVTTQQDIISTRESTTAAFRYLLAWVAGVAHRRRYRHHEHHAGQRHRTHARDRHPSSGRRNPTDIRIQFLTEALLLAWSAD